MCRIDQLLEQVDQGSQVMAVEPIQIAEDIAVPRRDSDLTAWVLPGYFSCSLLICMRCQGTAISMGFVCLMISV